ncbi:MAG: hypothetical protein ACC609_06815 [Methanobacterium formicicum]
MAVAKNFASYGIWGVTKYGFTSATSSILWPALLAGLFKILGPKELIPFVLNIIFATSTLILINYVLKKYAGNIKFYNFFIFIVLVAVIFFTPMIPLIFTGMENILQIFLTVAFVYKSARILSEKKSGKSELLLLLILAALLTLNRYENSFTIIAVGLMFVIYKRKLQALFLFLAGSIPLILYGIISKIQGWYFLPNSLVLKSVFLKNPMSTTNTLFLTLGKLLSIIYSPHLLILFILSAFLLILIVKNKTKNRNTNFTVIILSVFCINLILHILFAQTGWFYRYEAYLIVLGLFGISLGISLYLENIQNLKIDKGYIPKKNVFKYLIIVIFICILMTPMVNMGYESITSVPQASKNIYEQQYQMALFLKEYYQGETVGLNDIGVINYNDDIKCLDLWGLASFEVAEKREEGKYGVTEISDMVKNNNVSVIIIYNYTLGNNIPPDWIKVGEWEIKDNVACGDSVVLFYAPNPKNETYLREKLRMFSSKLPKDVEQSGEYLVN